MNEASKNLNCHPDFSPWRTFGDFRICLAIFSVSERDSVQRSEALKVSLWEDPAEKFLGINSNGDDNSEVKNDTKWGFAKPILNPLFKRCLIACIFLLMLGAGPCLAQNSSTHTVQAGETLFGIAEQYQVSVQQLKSWNDISGSGLSVGQKLVIKKGASESGKTHTVKPKESLYSISKTYGVSIDDIKKWNGLGSNELSVGQELKIYSGESSQQAPAQTAGSSGPGQYTVKSGDSLFRIAKLHNMTVDRLKALNELSSNNIQVGQKLLVQPTDQPPSLAAADVNSSAQGNFIRYTLKETQSRSELLEKFQMDETEFQALNPGRNSTSFRSGDTVNLLAPANQSFKNPYQSGSSMSRLGTAQAVRYRDNAAATTTSGELYNPKALTGAHSSMAMGSVIFVQNGENGRGVLLRINDRTTDSGLKLSDAVWDVLALNGNNAKVTLFRSND